jgi:hypothetical protein
MHTYGKAAEALQLSINEELATLGKTWLSITLDSDADVLDLNANVDVRVLVAHECTHRMFTIITGDQAREFVKEHVVQLSPSCHFTPACYCSGGPLCIVNKVTGQSVVAAVLRYLIMESGGLIDRLDGNA